MSAYRQFDLLLRFFCSCFQFLYFKKIIADWDANTEVQKKVQAILDNGKWSVAVQEFHFFLDESQGIVIY